MYRFIVGVIALLIVSGNVLSADATEKALAIVKQNCAACHGPDGNSLLPANPKLAGQHREYMLKQLKEFKSGARRNPVMASMLGNLVDEDLSLLASHFSAQNSASSSAKDKSLALQGRAIYRGGLVSKAVPACSGCHSPNGAGIPAQFPRLAGQHAEYVAAQLKAFRAGERSNDLNHMMQTAVANLNDGEISALAEYIAGLR
ncbi:MAG: c-type cytochrome [Burkholderiales bacterium]|jgi:cytochrome c553